MDHSPKCKTRNYKILEGQVGGHREGHGEGEHWGATGVLAEDDRPAGLRGTANLSSAEEHVQRMRGQEK